MNTRRMVTIIRAVIYFIVSMGIIVACDTQQGMMHRSDWSMNTGNWNWVPILISLGIGFLLGYLVARRKR